jgi:NAD(P)-dependent dehydrogenase (short-subunit alcohol dehydrogenase family)
VALAFAREGADVLVSYLNEDEDAGETKGLVEDAGRHCHLLPGDISSSQHCRNVVKKAVDIFGHIDILVNNAAHQMSFESIDDISDEDCNKTFASKYFGDVLPDKGCRSSHAGGEQSPMKGLLSGPTPLPIKGPSPMPRPPHHPDAKSRRYVKSAAALGVTQAGLSHILGCSIGTLKKHYAHEMAHGTEELVLAIGSRLVKQSLSKSTVSRTRRRGCFS